MVIAIDLTSLDDNFSGIERYALCMTKEMIQLDTLNQYMLIFKNSIHSDFLQEHANVKRVVIKGKKRLLFNQILLPICLYKLKADKYIFFAFPSPIFFRKKGMICTIHDMGAWDCPLAMKKLSMIYFKLSYIFDSKKCESMLTVSEFSKRRICNILKMNEDKVHVVYSGLAENKTCYDEKKVNIVKKKYGLPDNYILCLATLEPRKNLPLLIKAYSILAQKKDNDYKLVLAGRKGWKVDDLLDEVAPEVTENIIFTGFVDEEDLPVVYKLADCFVFPSIYEGFGLPPVEAISYGTCVISSNAASLPEILSDGAIYFTNNSCDDLVQKLIGFYSLSLEEKMILKDKAKDVILKYTFEKSANNLLKIMS